jgi:hypothetical protein
MDRVNSGEKLSEFSDEWKPKIVGKLNGPQVKLVKSQGSFLWHYQAQEGGLFLVVKGHFRMEFLAIG